jgi:F-type H+-transporting ATPase subunit c
MRRKLDKLLVAFGALFVSGIALAQGGDVSAVGLVAIGSGLVMGLAALGGTLAMGKAAGSALEGIARNPSSKDQVFTPMILALALIEFQAIMGFIIAILWWIK